ncbi:MAG: hypothetical protein Q9227_000202 [Pyrenula ochraceoflavens]
MRFSSTLFILTPILSLPVSLAQPTTKPLTTRDLSDIENAIGFGTQNPDCDLLKCAGVVASAACIVASIPLGPAGIPGVLGCAAGGAGSICPCAPCIDKLEDFLTSNNVCPAES